MFVKIGDQNPIVAVYKSTEIDDAIVKESLKSAIKSIEEKQDKETPAQVKEESEKN